MLGALVLALVVLSVPSGPVIASHDRHHIAANGWDLRWEMTATDGLAIERASFRGRRVLERVSVPQCMVVYFGGTPTMKDQLGTSGNIRYIGGSLGTSRSSSALAVQASFQCCGFPAANSYRYKIRYVFETDGDWRPTVYVYGPGIEPRARYECHIRADLNLSDAANDWSQAFSSSTWRTVLEEGRYRDDGASDEAGDEWRTYDRTGWGYAIDPRPTDREPSMYVLRWKSSQGASDLGSVASPGDYDNDESVRGGNVVHWYKPYAIYQRPRGCPGSGCLKDPIEIGPAFEHEVRIIP